MLQNAITILAIIVFMMQILVMHLVLKNSRNGMVGTDRFLSLKVLKKLMNNPANQPYRPFLLKLKRIYMLQLMLVYTLVVFIFYSIYLSQPAAK